MSDIALSIRKLIEKNLAVFEDSIFKDSDNIFELGFVNSMFAMKIVDFIENTYKIKINDDELDIKNFYSINKIVNFINQKSIQMNQ